MANVEQDPGFGSVVSKTSQQRLLNRDGGFNVARNGLSVFCSMSAYQSLVTMGWAPFLVFVVAAYLGINCFFAWLYLLCGPGALQGADFGNPFAQAFFFSIHTLATIGYGQIVPHSLAANIVVTAEALTGLLLLALATGIFFARFSRPSAQVIYSERALISPYRGVTGLQFRLANARRSQLLETSARAVMSRFVGRETERKRVYTILELERDRVAFLPLSWTVVHPIDEKSPLYGVSEQDLLESDAEILILITAIDETFGQMVHSRTSYLAQEIVWNAKFESLYISNDNAGQVAIDVGKLSAYVKEEQSSI